MLETRVLALLREQAADYKGADVPLRVSVLAKATGASAGSVWTTLFHLERKSLLTIQRRNRSNTYRLSTTIDVSVFENDCHYLAWLAMPPQSEHLVFAWLVGYLAATYHIDDLAQLRMSLCRLYRLHNPNAWFSISGMEVSDDKA